MQTVQLEPSAARLRGIRAGSASGAPGRATHNPAVLGSSPTRPPDPLTGWEIRFRKSCKTERAAQVELGKLLALAQDGSPTRTSPWPNSSTSTCQQPDEMCPPGKATSEIAVRGSQARTLITAAIDTLG